MMLHAFTDGASRGNPGEAGIGGLARNESGAVVFSFNGYIGETTNNVAEYTALLALLKRLQKERATRVVIHSDSELMVRQLNGQYKVKDPHLLKCFRQVHKLLARLPFEVEFRHIAREQNSEADRLANLGIETRKKIVI
jgi:ribonuclease HI